MPVPARDDDPSTIRRYNGVDACQKMIWSTTMIGRSAPSVTAVVDSRGTMKVRRGAVRLVRRRETRGVQVAREPSRAETTGGQRVGGLTVDHADDCSERSCPHCGGRGE
jgi:hypothetical protein